MSVELTTKTGASFKIRGGRKSALFLWLKNGRKDVVKERYKEGPDGREKGQNMSLYRGGKDQIDGIKDDVGSETNAEHFETYERDRQIFSSKKIENF